MTNIDPGLIAKAKEWAKDRRQGRGTPLHLWDAAVEVITALPDQIIDADKVQEVMEDMAYSSEQTVNDDEDRGYDLATARWKFRLEALAPTPKPKTLADLIEEGHDPAQYQWMQAEHRNERCIISRINSQDPHIDVSLLTATGATIWVSPDEVIPLPDKPCLVWPASEPEPAEEVPNDSTEPQAGEAWLVSTREGEQREALKAGNRWYVKDGDDVEEWVEEALIPIARLAPEVDPKALLTEEDYRDAPRDTVVKDTTFPFSDVWDKWYENEWRTTTRNGSGKGHTNAEMADTTRQVIWAPEVQA